MMIRTASGPALVNPIDFGERRKPLSRASWAAIGVVALAHVGVGAALYYQRFELPPALISAPETPPIQVEMLRPKPPEPVVAKPEPPAANAPIHQSTPVTRPVETVTAVKSDHPGPTINPVVVLNRPIAMPSSTGTGTVPIVIDTPPSVINHPHWIRQPTGDQLMRAYPRRAIVAGVAGSASLTCVVQASGSVSDCVVTSETPGSYGFGRAAQSLSRQFRISPRTVDGQVVSGARVNINLRFTLPED
ncbi:TonB family protein [uncultured Brevundimonas sp.]|uniref:TonB family protein n=1 Tax=uncultured Brevundimonas sp. TaxID=213418 RepID=UPI0030ED3DEC|tara:strand:+ start:8039 stop:8779 length:741 start_codon:yes stop_codon:yes gene_type:complete